MQFETPLTPAKFVKRYKRFFADVEIAGRTVTAHVPNTGSLKTCLFEGADCWVSETNDPARKLKATLQCVDTPRGWAGVNTALPNLLVHEAWSHGRVPAWQEFGFAKREVKISAESRIDLVLARDEAHFASGQALHHIEVKNVTLANDHRALFPDSATERGRKHLRELVRLMEGGHTAEMVFVIQREGCTHFAPADEIDAEYGRLLREAMRCGVKVSAYACEFDAGAGRLELNCTCLGLEV
jgi:sugar fermentation stimulation protein A